MLSIPNSLCRNRYVRSSGRATARLTSRNPIRTRAFRKTFARIRPWTISRSKTVNCSQYRLGQRSHSPRYIKYCKLSSHVLVCCQTACFTAIVDRQNVKNRWSDWNTIPDHWRIRKKKSAEKKSFRTKNAKPKNAPAAKKSPKAAQRGNLDRNGYCRIFFSTMHWRKKLKKLHKAQFNMQKIYIFLFIFSPQCQESWNFEKLIELLALKIDFFHIFYGIYTLENIFW